MNTKELLKVLIKILSIYLIFHLSKVCFDSETEIFNEYFLKNMLFLSISITIYYLFIENIIYKTKKI